jgi:hypothetical protein
MAPASLTVPAPKTMRVAVANSNFIALLEFKLQLVPKHAEA